MQVPREETRLSCGTAGPGAPHRDLRCDLRRDLRRDLRAP